MSLVVASLLAQGSTLTSIVAIEIANSIGGFKITPPSEVLLHYDDTRERERDSVFKIGMAEPQDDIIRRKKGSTWSF